jgi:hypothetical protein
MATCYQCAQIRDNVQALHQRGALSWKQLRVLEQGIAACQSCAGAEPAMSGYYGQIASIFQGLKNDINKLVQCLEWVDFVRTAHRTITDNLDNQATTVFAKYAKVRQGLPKARANAMADYIASEQGSCRDPELTAQANWVVSVLRWLHSGNGGGGLEEEAVEQLAMQQEFEALQQRHAIEALPVVSTPVRAKTRVALT